MKTYLTIFCCIFLLNLTAAQYYIKNSGIKTSLSARNQLIQQNKTQETQNYYVDQYGNQLNQYDPVPSHPASYVNQYGPSYKPAEVYMGEEMRSFVMRTTEPPILDPIALFINKTRSQMASGVCFKEVATASLAHSRDIASVVGNGTKPDMSRIQVCCAGYVRNLHIWQRCEPVCKHDCQNGICTAPNNCVCLPGYVQDHEGFCKSTCPVGCANGVCAENGDCNCKPGYKLDPTHKKFCVPQCQPECQHGRCVEPNVCACEQGYRADADGRCHPVCDSCDNGQCTAPGLCQCHEGYQKTNGICEAVCRAGCEKGRCIRPDVCECEFGLDLDASGAKCVPHCDRTCVNGVCDGHNTCNCNPGYGSDQIDWSVCNPICEQGCPQGYCSAPNLCRCNPGYIKSGIKGRTLCIPA